MRLKTGFPLRRPAVLLAGTTLLAGTACRLNDVFNVPDPGVATPASLQNATALPAILAGALGDLKYAYAGSNGDEGIANYSGLLSDEFLNSETFPTRIEIDQRTTSVFNGNNQTIYSDLQRARASADRAERSFKQFASADPTGSGAGETMALSGFADILVAEAYCNGVPFSQQNPDGSFSYGAPQTNDQIYQIAVAKFDSALAQSALSKPASASDSSLRFLAQVGRGRALLDLNKPADAAAAVAGVPTSFNFQFQSSTNTGRENNGLFIYTILNRRWTITDVEGKNGMPFRSANDPRVPWTTGTALGRLNVGFDNLTPQYYQQKYPDYTSPISLANGVEARLIEAEAALAANNTGTFLTTLNSLRANTGLYACAIGVSAPQCGKPLAPLSLPATTAAQQDLLFSERAFWLYGTAHRLGDLRREIRQYNRGAETVFPTGDYPKGGTYGPDVNLPIPQQEFQNPSAKTGCTDRSA